MNSIAVYGGTFDPVHYGHLSLAKAALNKLRLDELYFLPAGIQPFKMDMKVTSKLHRLNMLKLAIKDTAHFKVFTSEVEDEKVSYTYNTLVEIKEKYNYDKIYFVLGIDSFLTIDKWYKSDSLLREFAFVVGERPGYKSQALISKVRFFKEKFNTDITVLENALVDVSSSEIKEKLKAGDDVSSLIPRSVENYINEYRLY